MICAIVMTEDSRMIQDLRKQVPNEEFDYQILLEALKTYERPRDKITALLKRKDIVRVKKGIYVFGEGYRRRPFSREVLANMIFGPSYVSLDYALHYYGLIPERVETITSVTPGRSRQFSTPVGLFTYRGIPDNAYPIGIAQVEIEGRSFFIATPEKALCDKLYDARGIAVRSRSALKEYLLMSLRIDEEELHNLDTQALDLIAKRYRSRKIRLLTGLVRHDKTEGDHE
jgi:predicted transcriptional regulator of viral defense system